MLPDIKDDAHYDELWTDDELWERAVREVLDAAHISSHTLERIPGGSNIIYALDDARVFKLFAPLYLDDALIEEEGLDVTTCANLGLPSPEILERGEHEGWRWLVMTRLHGVNPIVSGGYEWLPQLDARDRAHIIGQLGDWMRASWESSVFQSMNLPERWTDWEAVQRKLRSELVQTHQRRGATQPWLDQLEPFFEGWQPLTATRVVHADLHGRNLLVSDRSGRWEISGVLDFADTLHAPPLYDLAAPVIYMVMGEQALATTFYERLLGTPHGLDAKQMMQWILLHRFSNLGFYSTHMPHVAGRCDTLDEMARLMTGLG